MLSPEQFFGFLVAAVLITLSPGPDNLMVLGVGISRGRRFGMAFGLGCAAGCLSHTLLAVMGVSALIAASPDAFLALKVVGGLYLVYLGVQALRSRGGMQPGAGNGLQSVRELFFRGMLANAINPKVVMFFLAFLPQFVVSARGDIALQMASLGVLFAVQAGLLFGCLGYFAGSIGQWLNRQPRIGLWLDRLAGAIFVGLGLRLIAAR